MIERLAHVVTEEGFTYAVGMEGDTVRYALLVDEPEHALLNDQVSTAINEWDMEQIMLASELTELLAYGGATAIGAYFEVNV